jgi:hypothetical protein
MLFARNAQAEFQTLRVGKILYNVLLLCLLSFLALWNYYGNELSALFARGLTICVCLHN